MSVSRRHLLGAGAAACALPAVTGTAAAAPVEAGAMVNAASLGLKPNGKRTQTRAFLRALETAGKRGAGLFLPAGSYRLAALSLNGDHHIVGVPGRTRLELVGKGPLLRFEDCERVTLDGLTISAANSRAAKPGLIAAANVAAISVSRCRFAKAPGNGLALDTCAGLIAHNTFETISDTAIFSTDGLGLEITGNTITGCGNNGIRIWRGGRGPDGTRIVNNRIKEIRADKGGSGQYGNGINVYKAGDVIVAHNLIEDCAFTAIRGNSASGLEILNNQCRNLGEVAIYAEFAFEACVITGNLVDGAGNGISITNFKQGGRLAVCANNIVRNVNRAHKEVSRHVGIFAEADTLIEGNVVEAAADFGVMLGWGRYQRDVSAVNNIIRECGIGIGASVSPGAGQALIANNLISKPQRGGIAAMTQNRIVERDLNEGTARKRFSHVTLNGNVVTGLPS
jgi:uncharacterized secreted repeat protein (TIGR03808 family)